VTPLRHGDRGQKLRYGRPDFLLKTAQSSRPVRGKTEANGLQQVSTPGPKIRFPNDSLMEGFDAESTHQVCTSTGVDTGRETTANT